MVVKISTDGHLCTRIHRPIFETQPNSFPEFPCDEVTRKTQGDFTSVESSVSQRDFEIFKKKRSPEKRRERESRDFEDVDV